MTKPARQKLALFVVLTVVYWALALLPILFVAVRTCGMSPDIVATCDVTPIWIAVVLTCVIYFALAILFVRARAAGVD